MLRTYEKFRLTDLGGQSEFFVEVNYSRDKKVKDCQVLKFTFPDGKQAVISKRHILGMLFTMGTEDEQQKLTPQTLTKQRWYETILAIKAKRDIYKGENINVPVKLSLPDYREEVFGKGVQGYLTRP